MPIYQFECRGEKRHQFEQYLPLTTSDWPACLAPECAQPVDRIWSITCDGARNGAYSAYPYTTCHINGKPIEIKSSRHLSQIEKQFKVRLRDDKSYIDEAPRTMGGRRSKESVERGRQIMRDIMASIPRGSR